MFTRSALYVLFAAAITLLAVQGNQAPGKLVKSACPSADKCYNDTIEPVCTPGVACPMWRREVVACAWSCENKNLPSGCTQRCKPCKAEVCAAVCECEIVCEVSGPCKAGKY
ncbi:hypothetical protein IW152_000460 [Coemansia sp. BCRC 34962]|nr:hypothetical protein IW152_000460 [Coemansia sp. BCRC 34962]